MISSKFYRLLGQGQEYLLTIDLLDEIHRFVSRVLKAKHEFKLAERNNLTVGSVFDSLSKKHPDKVCFYFGDQVWTYKQVKTREFKTYLLIACHCVNHKVYYYYID